MLSMMVPRLMGHQNRNGHDGSTSSGMKSTRVNCSNNTNSSNMWWNNTIQHTNMNRDRQHILASSAPNTRHTDPWGSSGIVRDFQPLSSQGSSGIVRDLQPKLDYYCFLHCAICAHRLPREAGGV